MRTGKIFDNVYSFTDYFAQGMTDCKGTRAMVNGSDHAADIANLATFGLEAKRIIHQGGVRIDALVIRDENADVDITTEKLMQEGKRFFFGNENTSFQRKRARD